MNKTNIVNQYLLTPPLEVFHLSTIYSFSHLLILAVLSSFPTLDNSKHLFKRILIEATILMLPFLLGVTLLESINITIPYLLLGLTFHFVFTYSRVYPVLKWPEIVFHTKPMPVKLPFITNLLANVVLTVSIVILAVDFQIFPDRFAKSKVYGWTLMDVGIVYFIAINAFLAPESRLEYSSAISLPSSRYKILIRAVKSSGHLILLGGLRMWLVAVTGYHQEITEYGLNWNFFIVLVLIKIISALILYFFPSSKHVGLIIALFHQTILSLGLNKFILSPDRNGYFRANKEGIFSLPGYIAIYLYIIPVARILFEKRNRRSNLDNIFYICDLLFAAATSAGLGLFAHYYIETASRRQCNLAFICFSISVATLIVATEISIAVLVDIFQYFGFLKKPPLVKSLLNDAIARNGLATFLFANILTGLVNLTLQPKSHGPFVAMIILIFYSYCVCSFAVLCHLKKLNLDFFSNLGLNYFSRR